MGLDIFVAIILAISVISGYRRGFTESLLHSIGWILSIILAYLWTPVVAEYIKVNTGIEEGIKEKFTEKLSDFTRGIGEKVAAGAISGTSPAPPPESTNGIIEGIPKILRDYFSDAINTVTGDATEKVADLMITIIALIVIILAIKSVFWLIIKFFSKKDRDGGIIAFSDGILGGAFGLLRGFLLVCVLMAILLPTVNTYDLEVLRTQLEESTFAVRIYDYNPIFFLTRLFF